MGKVYNFPRGHKGGPSLMGSNHVIHANFRTGKVSAAHFGKRTRFGRSVNRSVNQGASKAYHATRGNIGLYHVAAGLGAIESYGTAREHHNTRKQAFTAAGANFGAQLAVHHGARALGAKSFGAKIGSDAGGMLLGGVAAGTLAKHFETSNKRRGRTI